MTVSDTGCGMDEVTKSQIFAPFFTTKEVGKGTGLGLATVYGIVKQHEGLTHVYSEVGHGTTFKVYLPLLGKEPGRAEEEIRVEAPGGVERILLAEDDSNVRGLIAHILEQGGYQVTIARNGDEAIETIGRLHAEIDLVLLDVVMPKKGGREVFEVFRGLQPDGRALFMSGYSSGMIDEEYQRKQHIAFIQKPFSPEALLHKIRESLD
jgi:CheY-like chemotaxis protein